MHWIYGSNNLQNVKTFVPKKAVDDDDLKHSNWYAMHQFDSETSLYGRVIFCKYVNSLGSTCSVFGGDMEWVHLFVNGQVKFNLRKRSPSCQKIFRTIGIFDTIIMSWSLSDMNSTFLMVYPYTLFNIATSLSKMGFKFKKVYSASYYLKLI